MTEANFAQRAKLLRLEKEKREMEKSIEISRNAQAKVSELEKTNKKLYAQSHSDKKEIIKLREVSLNIHILNKLYPSSSPPSSPLSHVIIGS